MEEKVGQYWDRWIQKKSYKGYKNARVRFEHIEKCANIFFHAMGGPAAIKLVSISSRETKAQRNWLQRLSGTGKRYQLSWMDDNSLRLPDYIDLFPDPFLNKKLYFWLLMLLSVPKQHSQWLTDCSLRSKKALDLWPGFKPIYSKLVTEYLLLRPKISEFKKEHVDFENSIRLVLLNPGIKIECSTYQIPPHPVILWPDPTPPSTPEFQSELVESQNHARAAKKQQNDQKQRQGKFVQHKHNKDGMILFRFESIFSHAEYVNVNRAEDDDDDSDALRNADDMEEMALTRTDAGKGNIKMDLDLPLEEIRKISSNAKITLPEWNYKSNLLLQDQCILFEEQPEIKETFQMIPQQQRLIQKIKNQFASLTPQRTWFRAQIDGEELDLEACCRFESERRINTFVPEPKLFRHLQSVHRDLSCLLLADLSLSTDAWVNSDKQVIDIIKESLLIFSECLNQTGDRFAISGFWSKRNTLIKYLKIKRFNEKYSDINRNRISAIVPGYYTRMGAAIRYASQQLALEKSSQKLMLIITDGKPNDIDIYEGRYGIEDTRHAIIECRQKGLIPFCITIDNKAEQYLPHIFGKNGFFVIQKAEELPQKLPVLYARLTHLAQ